MTGNSPGGEAGYRMNPSLMLKDRQCAAGGVNGREGVLEQKRAS